MTLGAVRGQEPAVETLVRALRSGHVHHAYRFEGPEGVGKELAAFGLAQALLCTSGDALGCGKCDACQRVVALTDGEVPVPRHPDVLVIERALYPDLSDERGGKVSEKQYVSVAQIRTIVLERQGFPPVEGRARVFILRRPEELSVQAANCLLKTLEEPRQNTHFILVTARGDRLLPTIRSRTVPVRFRPLDDAILADLLREQGVPAARIDAAVALAGGSVTAGLELADEERSAQRAEFARAVLAAAAAGSGGAAAVSEGLTGARHDLKEDLLALSAHLRREALACAGTDPDRSGALADGFGYVLEAIERLEVSNAAPALTLSDLALTLQRVGAA